MKQAYRDNPELKEVYATELGSFMLYDHRGENLTLNLVEKIFSEAWWKSYYIDGKGKFIAVDNRNGNSMEFTIKQF